MKKRRRSGREVEEMREARERQFLSVLGCWERVGVGEKGVGRAGAPNNCSHPTARVPGGRIGQATAMTGGGRVGRRGEGGR